MAANWKMYKNDAETASYFGQFLPLVEGVEHCEIVICPPALSLPAAVQVTQETFLQVGGQNLHWAKEGAFTGEISGPMLKSAGANWVIVGHSERRQYFGETDESVMKKSRAALESGLTPIVCIGETASEREAGSTAAILHRQCKGGITCLTRDEVAGLVLAYEPVWAIGTGKTATAEMAADAHRTVRQVIAGALGDQIASDLRILYGGSVKPENARGLMSQEEIDGALVGGASLDPASFAKIVNFHS